VLEKLTDADSEIGVAELAVKIGLHPNTVRFHLDGLVGAGLAERSTEDSKHPGRHRMLYRASPESATAGRRSYQLLAEILAGQLACSRRPAAEAIQAGRVWGRYVAPPNPPFRQVDADEAIGQLLRILTDIGFDPEVVTTNRSRAVELHHCPFREIAAEHGQVVCSVHLGLMQGFLAGIGAPVDAAELQPFAAPSVCRVQLRRRPRGRPVGAI
jgi:predicted ArsR family transcriptional regulator